MKKNVGKKMPLPTKKNINVGSRNVIIPSSKIYKSHAHSEGKIVVAINDHERYQGWDCDGVSNIWFTFKFKDGTSTTGFEEGTFLLENKAGQDILREYLTVLPKKPKSKKNPKRAKGFVKYIKQILTSFNVDSESDEVEHPDKDVALKDSVQKVVDAADDEVEEPGNNIVLKDSVETVEAMNDEVEQTGQFLKVVDDSSDNVVDKTVDTTLEHDNAVDESVEDDDAVAETDNDTIVDSDTKEGWRLADGRIPNQFPPGVILHSSGNDMDDDCEDDDDADDADADCDEYMFPSEDEDENIGAAIQHDTEQAFKRQKIQEFKEAGEFQCSECKETLTKGARGGRICDLGCPTGTKAQNIDPWCCLYEMRDRKSIKMLKSLTFSCMNSKCSFNKSFDACAPCLARQQVD